MDQRHWEWSHRYEPHVVETEMDLNPPEDGDVTRAWCEAMFPEPHNALQMGVVDYLIHGGDGYQARSLQPHNMQTLAPIIKDVLRDEIPPEDENLLVPSIVEVVKKIQQRAYSVGIPDKPVDGLAQPRIQRAVGKNVLRPQQSLFGMRVASIEHRTDHPGGVKSSRLHALGRNRSCVGKKRRDVVQQLESIRQPLA